MIVAYLMNQYPMTSVSFIRREMAELEDQGITVVRFSIRTWDEGLVEQADKEEARRTRVIMDEGPAGLVLATLGALSSNPVKFLGTLLLTLRVGWRSDRGLLIHLGYLAEACVLARWTREAGAEHVHAHFGTNATAVAMLCRALGGPPYSFTAHGPEEFEKAQALSLAEKIDRAVFVSAISSFCRGQLFRWSSHEQWSKIHVIRCGVDGAFLPPAPPPLPAERGFVCVGRLGEQKGHLLLLESTRRLVEEGRELKIVLVGDGPLRAQLEDLRERAGLNDYVEITGWASGDQVRRWLAQAQVMVLASLAEGLPVVIMEALALGRPVISTYVAGIPELVIPGECGWLVPAGSVDDLTAAMRAALETPREQLAEMGRRGAERVARLHDARAEARKLAALLADRTGGAQDLQAMTRAAAAGAPGRGRPAGDALHGADD